MTSKLFSISCQSGNSTLASLLQHVAQTGHRLCTVSQSSTDIQDVILITLELEIAGHAIDGFMEEILAIQGVQNATVSFGSVLHAATYHLKYEPHNFDLLQTIRSHNTQIINISADKLLILHVASEKDIRALYNKLDTASLIGFSQMPVPIGEALFWNEMV